ncbi:MAG: glycoside hydrolase family 88/105 protein [Marinifilaceae bacterium]
MKKLLFTTAVFLTTYFPSFADGFSSKFEKKDVLNVMNSVADWQIDNFKNVKHQPLGWENAAMYMGMVDWAELAEKTRNDQTYYKFLSSIFNKGGWQPAKRMYHADDICISQVYIDMYKKYNRKGMIDPTIARTDWVMKNPAEQNMELNYSTGKGLDLWTWCDALFMAPPVYAKLYALTGDKKYIKYMNSEFMKTYNYLYDKDENLFYRDWRYFTQREKNGEKVFWGRGNGWVLGGLCEILQALPKSDKHRKFYEQLFVELCNKVIKLQQEDGYWRASLLDPASFPSPETSASGFIVYAFAYGINQNILPKTVFMPALTKGWDALVRAVETNGKLGYVQPIGADPRAVTKDMTEVYGVGAFLLAGTQIYEMSAE